MCIAGFSFFFFFSSRRRHTRYWRDWSSDVCSSDLEVGRPKIAESPVSEPSESAAESTSLAWDHLYSSSSPGLRRWLTTGQPVALHQDMLMVAVPNIFTRNQLENRFRPDI